MTIVITDPAIAEQLAKASGSVVDLRDANGIFLGTFTRPSGVPPPGFKWPFTDEEIEKRRKQPDGRPLADIFRDLESRG